MSEDSVNAKWVAYRAIVTISWSHREVPYGVECAFVNKITKLAPYFRRDGSMDSSVLIEIFENIILLTHNKYTKSFNI